MRSKVNPLLFMRFITKNRKIHKRSRPSSWYAPRDIIKNDYVSSIVNAIMDASVPPQDEKLDEIIERILS